MADTATDHFRDKSITELVHELNNLGDDHVAMQPTTLIAIQDAESDSIRRFRSRSLHKSRQSAVKDSHVVQSEFFLADGSQKKYYYNQIDNELEPTTIATVLSKFEQNFNTTIVMQYSLARFHELLTKMMPWFEEEVEHSSFLAYFLEYQVREAVDLLSGTQPKAIPLAESVGSDHPFYQTNSKALLKINSLDSKSIKILTLMKNNQKARLRVVMLPTAMLGGQVEDAYLKIVRSQLTQILNYIKTYPNKKYENINKLLPKRYPTTTAIAEILLYDSANYILNWVTDNKESKPTVNGRFDFFDRFAGISNLIKKVPRPSQNIKIIKRSQSQSRVSHPQLKSPRATKLSSNFSGVKNEIDETKTRTHLRQESHSMSELEYCRTFQRKTHRFSIEQMEDKESGVLFPDNVDPSLNENEAIALLKAKHAREISQYHETIQNLNQKILILTSEKGLSDLYTIHEREIMLLEIKIDELRKDISKLCSKSTGSKEAQNLKAMIKKLNDQVAHFQKANPTHKLAQGKIKMLEKENNDLKAINLKSENARKELTAEIEALTQRLKIKDQESNTIKDKEVAKHTDDDLAAKDMSAYSEIEDLLSTGTKPDCISYVLRRVKDILGDLSEVREAVLECNNFLVDLQEHLEINLSQKFPQVVLDCNRFIRSFLLQNLNVF